VKRLNLSQMLGH